ncbi:T9SS type A sorting domain-containing protein [Rufibacter sp. XAAS-G3-1]|uniref:T9SS type A sorting domain-containing protein n=1 Tax=Rufibacter sp. XAAS-G3-1 TaxID=2729134 RepID=UPI0015E6B6AF
MMKKLLLLLLCAMAGQQVTAQQLAFPGAEGFGRYTTGGRGGAVLEVTNLNDAGPGSLRAAVNASGARTVVFRVSGTIALASSLTIKNPNITIAGQTAPGDGICLKNYPVTVDADNVIIRYLRFRMGDEAKQEGDAFGGRFHKNIIIDHCSMSWSTDECVSFYANENFTLQWSIISESLRNSAHTKGAHGYGGIWGGKNASFHHNLMAHHDSRNPRLGEEAGKAFALTDLVDVRNNVFYNWANNSIYGGEAMNVNIVNNYYKPGPATTKGERIISIDKNKIPGTEVYDIWGKFYIDGNVLEGSTRATNDNWTYGVYNQFHNSYGTVSEADKAALRKDTPHAIAGNVTTHSAQEAYEHVLAKAGASLKRDAVDARVIETIRNKTFTAAGSNGSTKGIIDSQNDVGGWPTLNSLPAPADTDKDGMPNEWETKKGLDPANPEDRNQDANADGYTNLEEYLNGLVLAANLTSSPESQQMAGEKLFPNPFTTSTTVIFVAKQRTKALVNVMDTSGKQVATLLDASVSPGTHSVTWHGTTASGSRLPGGVYFISVQVGSEKTTKRVALLNKL